MDKRDRLAIANALIFIIECLAVVMRKSVFSDDTARQLANDGVKSAQQALSVWALEECDETTK